MGKNPAFQWYPADWTKDPQLKMACHASKGIWIDLIAYMWEAPVKGEVVGTEDQIQRMVGATKIDFDAFLMDIKSLHFGNVTNCNGIVTVRNRRMYREQQSLEEQRKQTRERVAKHRLKQNCNSPETPCTEVEGEVEEKKELKKWWGNQFDVFWKEYPNKAGKKPARIKWNKIEKQSAELFQAIMDGLGRAKASNAWLKDEGDYIPHPTTWLNNDRWEDEFPDDSGDTPEDKAMLERLKKSNEAREKRLGKNKD